ncbi:MAG: aminotransferase V [delta proteobacterium ML8_F1]|nr:MAG: aminotransferase V [delta proteobacterium ML8_F1]
MKNKRLVMIPGPTPVVRSIQDEMGRETVAFGDPAFVKDYKALINDLKEMWETKGEVFVIAGTGTLAMEMAIANITKKGDSILVVSHGYFGDRFIDLCERKGLEVDVLQSEWGQTVPLQTIEKQLKSKIYAAMTVTHVDTSTGVAAPIEAIGEMMKKFDQTLYVVDGVCATGAEVERVDEMGIDVLLTGSQKAFGVAPGIAMVWAGPRALERRQSMDSIPEFYVDFEKWLPIMADPSKYFATPAVNLVWAMKESVRIMKEEGLENRYARHLKVARAMQKALEGLGFTILANPENRAVTLSNLIYPEGIDDGAFRSTLAEEGIIVAGGLGAYAGKMFRLGHMGNVDMHDMVAVLATIERALYKVGYPVKLGSSVGTFMESMLK